MAASYDIQMKVPFHDLDPMQVVWHGNYFKYFDVARFGLFDSVGIDLYGYLKSRQMVFPITRSSVKHILPLRFDDSFVCRATVDRSPLQDCHGFRNPPYSHRRDMRAWKR